VFLWVEERFLLSMARLGDHRRPRLYDARVTTGGIVVTLLAAFGGGAGGAIFGPAITARFRQRERLAVRREQPYEQLIHAARAVIELVRVLDSTDPEAEAGHWYEVITGYIDATRAMEPVRSDKVHELAGNLMKAAIAAMEADKEHYEAQTDQQIAMAATDRDAAVKRCNEAYKALREQVLQETRG
jgi:hypothetical protein